MSTTRVKSGSIAKRQTSYGGDASLKIRERTSEPMIGVREGAIDRRVISPVIAQELKARGVAQVLVYMRTAVSQDVAASESSLPEPFRRYFVDSVMSSSYALRRAKAPRSRRDTLALSGSEELPPDVEVYANLGVVLGTVDAQGLAALQEHEAVAAVGGSPQFSLIRPEEPSDLALGEAELWGADALAVPRLWAEGLDGAGVLVGHLDTGVDATHPALKDAVAAFTDIDALGKVRASSPFDSGLHGTHTAGTIAGRKNNIGIAPGCKLVSACVIEAADVVRRILGGLNWVVGKGVRVINLSFGIRGYQEDFLLLMNSIRAKDILPIAAVGNEGAGTSRSPGNYANVLSVGAVDVSGRIWASSSSQRFVRASDPLVPDLVAPGVAIVSALKGGGYTARNGTSMAAPHIAGLAALLFQAQPTATAAQVEAAILASCKLRSTLDPERANRGTPNAVEALALLTGKRLSGAALSKSAASGSRPRSRVKLAKGQSRKVHLKKGATATTTARRSKRAKR